MKKLADGFVYVLQIERAAVIHRRMLLDVSVYRTFRPGFPLPGSQYASASRTEVAEVKRPTRPRHSFVIDTDVGNILTFPLDSRIGEANDVPIRHLKVDRR